MTVLYLHIPKTGGTSIKKALEGFDQVITENSDIIKNSEVFHKYHIPVMNFKLPNSVRFRRILNKKWDKLWKVAFVRNPWDRYVSNWKWLTRKEKLYPAKGWAARGWLGNDGEISFEDFVKQMSQCYIELKRLHGYQHDKWHIRNQIEHIVDGNGNIMVDHVARFENIKEEFDLICSKASIKTTLPHLNHSGHFSGEEKTREPMREHYSIHYTQELVEIVSERCKADISAFNYKFEWRNNE